MKSYAANELRNVAILGHGGVGKTSLVESILYYTGNSDRMGKIVEGNTICDFDSEEIKRKISISTAVAPCEYQDTKINFIDTPGYFDFIGELKEGISVADAAVIVVSAKAGVEVGTERAWKYSTRRNIPKLIYISKMDEENANYQKVVEELRETFGVSICPIAIPIFEDGKITGLVNCASMTARKYKNGKVSDIPMPTDMDDQILPIRNMIMESVAETSEELLDKFFSGEEFSEDEIKNALKQGIKKGDIVPVVCGTSITGLGVQTVLYNIMKYFPSHIESDEFEAINEQEEKVKIKIAEKEPPVLFVFKTVADQFVGKMSYFKVMSGTVKTDSVLFNTRTEQSEKVAKLFVVVGKKQIEVKELHAGDIGVVAKLSNTNTGDTLCGGNIRVKLPEIKFPRPVISFAINPKAKGDEEKIISSLYRLVEEDPTISIVMNPETKQQVLSGQGDMHIDVIVSKLKNKFGIDVSLEAPRVPYREAIRTKVEVEGKHKKQSGGHGQYGHVKVSFERCDSEDLVFEEKVFGGSVPKNYFPAVEKGLRDCIKKGVLAGYPVVNLKATLLDGSYHAVDSSEMAFKMAAALAYKAGLVKANPVLLEPIGKLEVHIPENNMGDVIGDINKRRGQVLGMGTNEEGASVVEAMVPMAEMNSYAIDLRSMTRGRGSFIFDFDSYQDAPPAIVAKVIEEAKAAMSEE